MKHIIPKAFGHELNILRAKEASPTNSSGQPAHQGAQGGTVQSQSAPQGNQSSNHESKSDIKDKADERAFLTSVCCSRLPDDDRERAQQLERFENLEHQTIHRIVGTAEAMSGWYDFEVLYQIDGPTPEPHTTWTTEQKQDHKKLLNALATGWTEYSKPPSFL